MPEPLLLRCPSGLYARYWVPLALREVVGSKSIVRSLGSLRAMPRAWKPLGLGMLWLIGLQR